MSKLLKGPVEFDEEPLYISINMLLLKVYDYQNLRNNSEWEQFLKRAKFDRLASGGNEVRILRIDHSGIHEIKVGR